MERAVSVTARRTIAADPTSTALLLASPSAAEIFPEATVEETDDGVEVAFQVPGVAVRSAEQAAGTAQAPVAVRRTLRMRPPHRTPTAYVLHGELHDEGRPTIEGVLTLEYAQDERGVDQPRSATAATLETFFVPDTAVGDPAVLRQVLQAMCAAALERLAALAEGRSRAA